jgi:hypothetical protein
LPSLTRPRLLAHRPRRNLPLLHAAPPAHMHAPLQHIMPARCPRRLRSPPLPTVYKIRCGAGHGYGQMHHLVFACLLGTSVSPVQHCLPGAHLPRSGEPLYTHVCDAEHGRQRKEPQGRGREQKLALEAVLLQQCMSKLSGPRALVANNHTESPVWFLRL